MESEIGSSLSLVHDAAVSCISEIRRLCEVRESILRPRDIKIVAGCLHRMRTVIESLDLHSGLWSEIDRQFTIASEGVATIGGMTRKNAHALVLSVGRRIVSDFDIWFTGDSLERASIARKDDPNSRELFRWVKGCIPQVIPKAAVDTFAEFLDETDDLVVMRERLESEFIKVGSPALRRNGPTGVSPVGKTQQRKPWKPKPETLKIVRLLQKGLSVNAILERHQGQSKRNIWKITERARKAGFLDNPDTP